MSGSAPSRRTARHGIGEEIQEGWGRGYWSSVCEKCITGGLPSCSYRPEGCRDVCDLPGSFFFDEFGPSEAAADALSPISPVCYLSWIGIATPPAR